MELFSKQADGSIRIPITDFKHRVEIGEFYGAARMLDRLEKATKKFGQLPGFNAALAVAEQHLAECRVRMYSHNVRTAAAAGVDLSVYTISSLEGEALICTPIPLGEEG